VTARDEVLARIRRANAAASAPSLAGRPGDGEPGAGQAEPRYRTRGDRSEAELIELLAGRLTDYRAIVRRTNPAGLAGEIAAALARRGARRVVVPPGLDLPGRDALPGVEVVTDDGLDARALDACDGAVTGAAVAIAETGTIVLDGSPDQGRRAITLVPDYHLCIVRAGQVVELVPEAVARLAPSSTAPLTWISGPSATSDIELRRVEGVHGPRTLEVILVGALAPAAAP
jgi:L-lactate dehydrogenase complex protein LldG